MTNKELRRQKIKVRVRCKISGTAEKPRMTVFRSNKQIYVQLIDDQSGKTLASASSLAITEKMEKRSKNRGNLTIFRIFFKKSVPL